MKPLQRPVLLRVCCRNGGRTPTPTSPVPPLPTRRAR